MIVVAFWKRMLKDEVIIGAKRAKLAKLITNRTMIDLPLLTHCQVKFLVGFARLSKLGRIVLLTLQSSSCFFWWPKAREIAPLRGTWPELNSPLKTF
jgi:hypothetical protein